MVFAAESKFHSSVSSCIVFVCATRGCSSGCSRQADLRSRCPVSPIEFSVQGTPPRIMTTILSRRRVNIAGRIQRQTLVLARGSRRTVFRGGRCRQRYSQDAGEKPYARLHHTLPDRDLRDFYTKRYRNPRYFRPRGKTSVILQAMRRLKSSCLRAVSILQCIWSTLSWKR